jgi:hypothetical protein
MLSELVAMWRAAIGKKRSGSKLCSPSFPAPLFHTETPKPTHGVTKKPDLERLAVLLVDVEQGDHEQACKSSPSARLILECSCIAAGTACGALSTKQE